MSFRPTLANQVAPPAPETSPPSNPDGIYWDGVVEGWEPTIAHRLWRAHSDAVNIQLLRRWLPGDHRLLLKTDLFDEAVGRGLHPELAGRSQQVVGIDLSSSAVRAASHRYPRLDARVADVLALPFDDSSFDVVVSNSTLDHFRSHATLRAALGELARVTQPGGRLVITLDNRTNPIVALRTSILFSSLHRLGVVPYFVGATCGGRRLATLLRELGFDVIELRAIMHCPPQIAARWAAQRVEAQEVDTELERRHLRHVLRFETMGRWPTAFLTGHFVGALAIKR